jgi:hypothetical protein
MPKLSVYVTDELWQRAKTVPRPGGDKPNNSQVVQWALEQLVKEQETRRAALSSSAAPDTARLASVVERLRAEAKAEYEQGYSAGLELAEGLGFDDLRVVMNAGGLDNADGREWLAQFTPHADEHPGGAWWSKYGEKFGSPEWEDEPSVPDFYWPSEAFCTGATEALQDVWEALRTSAWGRSEGQLGDDTADSSEEA